MAKGFFTQFYTFNDANCAHIVQCEHSNILSKPWHKLVPKVQHFPLLMREVSCNRVPSSVGALPCGKIMCVAKDPCEPKKWG